VDKKPDASEETRDRVHGRTDGWIHPSDRRVYRSALSRTNQLLLPGYFLRVNRARSIPKETGTCSLARRDRRDAAMIKQSADRTRLAPPREDAIRDRETGEDVRHERKDNPDLDSRDRGQ